MPFVRSVCTPVGLPRFMVRVRAVSVAALVLAGAVQAATGAPFPVADINPGTDAHLSSNPQNFVVAGRLAYFTAASGLGSPEIPQQLWRTDGTAAGTFEISDFATPPGFALNMTMMTPVGERLFFFRSDRELWVTDGTLASTRLLRAFDYTAGSRAVSFRGNLYFSAQDGVTGYELWRSDGTVDGTVMAFDFEVGWRDGIASNSALHASGDKLYFVAAPRHDGAVWVTDGTAAGTHLVSDPTPGLLRTSTTLLADVGGKTLFQTELPPGQPRLWATEGTTETTVGLTDRYPEELTSAGEYALFFPYDEAVGREPWVTDGTPEGTRMLVDLHPGPTSSFDTSDDAVAVDGVVYFVATTVDNGKELVRTDGTSARAVVQRWLSDGDRDRA